MEDGHHEEDVYERIQGQEEQGLRLSWASRIWNTQKPRSYGTSVPRIQGVDISMPSMSSSPGTVLNHDWPATKQWFCAIGST
jgi:hypothetical protein